MEQMQMKGLAADSDLAGNEKDAVRLLRDFDASIETGFQIACNHGPLCGEPVVGMAYILEAVNVNRVEGDEDSGEAWRLLKAIFMLTLRLKSVPAYRKSRVRLSRRSGTPAAMVSSIGPHV